MDIDNKHYDSFFINGVDYSNANLPSGANFNTVAFNYFRTYQGSNATLSKLTVDFFKVTNNATNAVYWDEDFNDELTLPAANPYALSTTIDRDYLKDGILLLDENGTNYKTTVSNPVSK